MRHRPALAYLTRTALLAAAYLAAYACGTLAAPSYANETAVWPAGGVALAGLVVLGWRHWLGVALGAFAATVLYGVAPPAAAALALSRALGWAACAWAVCSLARFRRSFPRARDVLALALLGAAPGALAATGAAVGIRVWMGSLPLDAAPGAVLRWAGGSITGALVVAPFLIAWSARPRPRPPGSAPELVVLLACGAVLSAVVFAPNPGNEAEFPLAYAIFPLVAWAALRLGARGAASLAVVVAAVAVARVAGGIPTTFHRASALHAMLFLQAYLSLVSVSGLLLAALTGERRMALERERRARRAAEAAERRQAFLGEVGTVLSGSLDYPETLAGLARVCVPRLGDGCILDEVREDGTFGLVATLHRDPAVGALLEETRLAYPPGANPNSRVAAVARSGRAERVADAGAAEGFAAALAVDPNHEAMLRAVQFRSVIFVPMVARERVVGVLTVLRTGPDGSPYTAADLRLAQEVARRAALYLDNARLYRSVRTEAAVRQRVISMVAHEVRSPLATILLNAGAVLDGVIPVPASASAPRHPLRAITVAADQIARLVQDLTDVTRLEAGSLPVERATFSPSVLLRETMLLLEPLATERSLGLEHRAPPTLPLVVGDRERTLQVLSNLVGNAVRAVPAGGTVTVEAAADDREVRFCVADTGPGIDAPVLRELLGPLWTVEHRPRGMGLPLSRAIVEAQGGRMWAESEPGAGSRFYFTLPVASPVLAVASA